MRGLKLEAVARIDFLGNGQTQTIFDGPIAFLTRNAFMRLTCVVNLTLPPKY
jgi:hypothetical protein